MTTTCVSRYAPALALAGALCFAAICIAAVDTAAATGVNAGIIIHERKARFNELSNVMRAIRKELDAPDPDFSRISDGAREVESLARRIPSWFPAGTGSESGQSTRAEDDIWRKPDTFRQASSGLTAAAASLGAGVAAKDVSDIRTRFHAGGVACQNCHDQFRSGWLW